MQGRAMAHTVCRLLLTARTRVRSQEAHVGFVVDEVAMEQVFSQAFRFAL
jgi:hypothetical protein